MKHGRSAYAKGCRCDACRAAQREYMRSYMRKNTQCRIVACIQCGVEFSTRKRARFCSRACYGESMASGVRRRKISKALRQVVYERDGWTCHICGDPVDRGAVVPELDAPTIDHVVALAAGGAHDESNLKTAHFYCNSVKRELPLSEVA